MCATSLLLIKGVRPCHKIRSFLFLCGAPLRQGEQQCNGTSEGMVGKRCRSKKKQYRIVYINWAILSRENLTTIGRQTTEKTLTLRAVSKNIIAFPRCRHCVSEDGGGGLPACAFPEDAILCRCSLVAFYFYCRVYFFHKIFSNKISVCVVCIWNLIWFDISTIIL